MKNLWPLLGLFFSLFGCASINKSPSVIRIDAKGSTLEVQLIDDEDQRKKVMTPALTTVAPGPSFQTSLKNAPHNKTHSCSVQWGKSILPNSIPVVFGPVGIGLALVFMTTDYLTGNIYDCNQLITLKDFKKTNKKKMIRAFIIPPHFKDSKVSDAVAQKFSEVVNKQKIKLTPHSSSKGELANLGINNTNSPKLKGLPYNRLRKFALIEDVEYAIYLAVAQENLKGKLQDQFKITPVLINLVTHKKRKLKSFNIEATNSSNSFWSSLAGVINFIPNSLTLSYYNKPRIDDQSNGKSSNRTQTHPDALPRIVNTLGMTSVIHPQSMRTWDYSFQTFASAGATSWSNTVGAQTSNISSLYALYNAQITGHFALGAINIDIGYGAGRFEIQELNGFKEQKYRSITRLGASYVAFLSHKLFVKMGADQFHINGGIGSTSSSATKAFYESYFGLGYYFPEFRYFVRDLF